MFEDMNDIEIYGPLTKKLPVYSTDAIDKLEAELVNMLQKYKSQMSVRSPLPKIRMWIQDNKVNFLFFDKATGRRVILGEWLQNKNGYYEH
jgi:hypothetical protein